MYKLDEPLPGLMVLQASPYRDERGCFTRSYCRESFASLGISKPVEQANLSWNPHEATLRGLHCQQGSDAEIKMVQCLKGAVFDVGVDIRPQSSTFGQWFGTTLSAQNGRMMVVPEGFAHGFLTLGPDTLVHYNVTAAYAPGAEAGYRYDDPFFAIDWPFEPQIISARDNAHPYIKNVPEPV